jgi:hypothetical protein
MFPMLWFIFCIKQSIVVLKIHPFPRKEGEEHNQGISSGLTSHVSLPPRATVYFRQGELRLQVDEIIYCLETWSISLLSLRQMKLRFLVCDLGI